MFTDRFELSYNSEMIHGAVAAINEMGHNLIVIPVLSPNEDAESVQNYMRFMTDFSKRLDIDGYIMPVGILTSHYGKDQNLLQYIVMHLTNYHVVCLEERIGDLPTITKDNEYGMSQLIDHLILHHHYQHFGIIAGEKTSFGSNSRIAVCEQHLRKYHIDYHIVHGSFRGECEDLIRDLLNEYPDIDVLVCLNDQIAFCAYHVIEEMGKQVGTDIGVTGYDDLPISALLDPPLSSVRSDAFEMGYDGGCEIINQIEGRPQQIQQVNSIFVDRCSAGDSHTSEVNELRSLIEQDPFPVEEITKFLCDQKRTEANQAFYDDIRKLVLVSEKLRHHEKTSFEVDTLRRILKSYIPEGNSDEVFSDRFLNYYNCLAEMDYDNTDIMHAVMNYKDVFIHYSHSQQAKDKNDNLNSQTKINRIGMEATQHAKNPDVALDHIVHIIEDLGFSFLRLYLLDQSIDFNEIPSQDELYLKAELQDGQVHVYDENNKHGTNIDKSGEGKPRNYVLTTLRENNRFIGFLMLDAQINQNENIYFISQQLSLSISYLKIIKIENKMINLLHGNNITLTQQAKYDELTGLYNRRGFYDEVSRINERYQGEKAVLYYMDLDRLKYINDHFGHSQGDYALKKASELLRQCFRSDDVLARMGGDEFVALAVTRDGIDHVTPRVKKVLANYNATGEVPYPIDLSIGYTVMICGPQERLNDDLQKADQMLYQVKRQKKVNRTE